MEIVSDSARNIFVHIDTFKVTGVVKSHDSIKMSINTGTESYKL